MAKRERGIDDKTVEQSPNCDFIQKFPVRRVGTGSNVGNIKSVAPSKEVRIPIRKVDIIRDFLASYI
jgi:hypothetical protein